MDKNQNLKKVDGRFHTLSGFIYALAESRGLLKDIDEIVKIGKINPEESVKIWHEDKGEFFTFPFDRLAQVAIMLGYKQSPIHHEAKAVSELIDDFNLHYKK